MEIRKVTNGYILRLFRRKGGCLTHVFEEKAKMLDFVDNHYTDEE